MSNALTDLRVGIRDQLEAGGFDNAYAYRPSPVVPPCALVVPSEPYVTYEAGTAFGYATANLEIVLIAGKGDNASVVERLDQMVLDALQAVEYTSADVSSYYLVTIAGVGDCLAASVAMPRRIQLP